MKNEKFLLDNQTKCGDIANKILNVAIDAERIFKCKWPYACQAFRTVIALKVNLRANGESKENF